MSMKTWYCFISYGVLNFSLDFVIASQVRGAMEIAVFIQNIQEERAEVALHIFSNPSDNGAMNGKALTERFEMTDRALEEMPTWPNVKYIKNIIA